MDKSNISKTLLKNTGIIAIGQISTKFINFLLLPLYTALLSKEEYGLVDLLSTYATIIIIVVGLQLSQAIFRFLITSREDKDHTSQIISSVSAFSILVLLIYAVVFAIVQPFINIECKWYLLIYVIAAIFLQTASGIARGLGDNLNYAVGNFIASASTLVLNVIFVAVFRLGVDSMLLAYVIGPIIGGCYIVTKDKILGYFSVKAISKSKLKKVLSYSVPLVPNELSWSIIHASDRMVITTVINVAANGLIAVASKFSAIYTTMFSVFNASWTEQIVLHYKDEGGPEYICEMFEKVVTFFACIAIGIIACMPFVFKIFVNEQFADAYNLVPLYMIAVFFNVIIGMISAIYLIENETKLIAITTACAAIINLLVDIVLVRFIGIYAAPISSICGYAFMSIWRLWDVNKRHCRIVISKKRILELSLLLIISMFSFYFDSFIINIVVLILIVCSAFWINRYLIKELIQIFQHRHSI